MKRAFSFLLVSLVLLIAPLLTFAASTPVKSITGAGSSFVYPLMAKWTRTYYQKEGVQVNYQSIGSAGGLAQLKAKTIQFAASDMPLRPEQLNKAGYVQFPIIFGGIVPIINVPGVAQGKLILTGQLLSQIFLGKITNWNDPAIATLNPGLKLPNLPITIIHRSDGSGTTFNFTHYLAQVSPEWQKKVGVDTAIQWPTGIGAKENAGVDSAVSRYRGSIGYVGYAYALSNDLNWVRMVNKAGKIVPPNPTTFRAAAESADWLNTQGFYLLMTNQPGAQSWPIAASTFILMPKTNKPAVTQAMLTFFNWAYRQGDKQAKQLDYIPVPSSVVKIIENSWEQELKDNKAQTLWPINTNKTKN